MESGELLCYGYGRIYDVENKLRFFISIEGQNIYSNDTEIN